MTLATNVRQRRKKLGITQAALGKSVGWHGSRISRVESGHVEPRLASLRKIAKALGLTIQDLIR